MALAKDPARRDTLSSSADKLPQVVTIGPRTFAEKCPGGILTYKDQLTELLAVLEAYDGYLKKKPKTFEEYTLSLP
jgi:hypothetical protein